MPNGNKATITVRQKFGPTTLTVKTKEPYEITRLIQSTAFLFAASTPTATTYDRHIVQKMGRGRTLSETVKARIDELVNEGYSSRSIGNKLRRSKSAIDDYSTSKNKTRTSLLLERPRKISPRCARALARMAQTGKKKRQEQ